MHWNFKNKIIVAFLAIVLFVLLYGVYGNIQLMYITKTIRTLHQHPILVNQTVKEINIELYKIAQSLNYIGNTQNTQKIDSIRKCIDKSNQTINHNFKIVYKRFLGKRNDIDIAWEFYRNYSNQCEEIMQLVHQNKIDSAKLAITRFNLIYTPQIEQKTSAITRFAKNKANQLIISSNKIEQNSLYLSIIIFITILALIVIIVFWLINSIVKPIANFLTSAQALFSIQTTAKEVKNETELFQIALNELDYVYQNIKEQNEEIVAQNEEYLQINEELKETNNAYLIAKEEAEKNEESAQNKKARLKTLIETLPDMVWLKDTAGAYVNCNPKFEKFIGVPEVELKGKTEYDFLVKEEATFFEKSEQEALKANKQIISYRWINYASDGHSEFAEIMTTPFIDSKGVLKGVMGIARDITALKQKENQLLKSYQELSVIEEELRATNEELQASSDSLIEINTKLTKTKEIVEISEQKLKEAQQLAKIGNWELDLVQNKLYWSDQIYRIFGCEPQEFGATYEAFLSYIHPDDRDLVNDAYTNHLKTKQPYNITHRILLPSGVLKYVSEQCKSDFDANDKPIRSVGAVADITESILFQNEIKQAKEQAEESEKRLSQALKATSDSIWDWNLLTNKTYYSPRWFEMLGYHANEFEMDFDTWKNLVHPDDFESAIKKINDILKVQKEKGYEAEFRMKHKSGEWIWILGRGNVIDRNENGEPILLSGTNTLIDERKKLEDTLIQNEAHLRTLIDTIPDLIWLKNTEGVYLQCNQRFEHFFGAAKHEIVGKTDYDFVSHKLADFFREKDKIAITSEKPITNEEQVTFANDGHIEILETTKAPVYAKDGQIIGVLGIGHNITERKKAVQALMESEIMISSVMNSTSDYIWSVSITDFGLLTFNTQMQQFFNKFWDVDLIPAMTPDGMFSNPKYAEFWRNKYNFVINNGFHSFEYTASSGNIILYSLNLLKRNESVFGISGFGRDITEQKQAEQALKESEEKYRYIIENAPIGIFQRTIEGQYNYCNLTLAKHFECDSIEEFLQHYNEIPKRWANPDKYSEFKELLAKNGKVLGFETETRLINGKTKWFSLFVELNSSKSVLNGFSLDITERKLAEQALKESEIKFYEAIEFQPIPIGIAVGDRIVHFNKEFIKTFGYTLDDVKSISQWMEIVYPNPVYREEVIKIWNKDVTEAIQSKNITPSREYKITCKDLSVKWVVITSAKVGEQLISTFENITERKHAEEVLRQSEARLNAILSSMKDVVFEIDSNNCFEGYFAQKSKNLYVQPEFFLGKKFDEILPKDVSALVHQAIKSINSGNLYHQFEYQLEVNNVVEWEHAVITPRYNKSNEFVGITSVCRNITEIKKAEIDLENYRNHLEELVKTRTEELNAAKEHAEIANQAKSEFLSNMSHELRTPLNAILGFAKLLGYQKNLTPKQKEQLTTIYQSGDHLLSLINDILDMSKIEAQKFELSISEINLPVIMQTVFNINKIKADEKELEYSLEKMVSLPSYVMGDERKLKQIMLNLINNAIKFTDEGKITIRVDYIEPQNLFIFEVEDTGIGIPIEKQSEIFEPFIQHAGKRLFAEGTGLGLSITKKLIQMMNGNLILTSQPDKGSIFRVQIPLEKTEKDKQFALETENNIITYLGERKKILVVDDNLTNVSFLVSLLEPLDFVIQTAENGEVGIQKAITFIPDLILLDYRMPIADGLEFIKIANQKPELKNIQIIGISATVYKKEMQEQFHQLCDDFVPKPVEINLLLKKIQQMLQIEWIYENLPKTTEKQFGGVLIFPDKLVISSLLENAEIGSFNEINEIIEKLEKENENLRYFCNLVKKFSRNYDREGILKIMKSRLEN